MRLAALYDIHGNLPALEAVLQDVRDAKVDQIVVGGDVVPGPMPRETLACLLGLNLPIQFIHGNGESAVLAQMAGKDPGVPEQARAAISWSAEQLAGEDRDLLARWPLTRCVRVPNVGDVLFCHATPRNDTEFFSRLTPGEVLRPIFDMLDDVALVVCGHTHMQFDRMIGRVRVMNAGSVGMPFADPGAYWLLFRPEPELRCTKYDLKSAAQRIRATNYPQAEEFAANNVLKPPTEASMLERFRKVELK